MAGGHWLTVVPKAVTIADMRPQLSPHGRWIADQRGEGRAVRVSSHVEGGFLVVSTWKEDTCVATVRLLPEEAALLVGGLAEGLGRLAGGSLDHVLPSQTAE